jgi:hypothetical protein
MSVTSLNKNNTSCANSQPLRVQPNQPTQKRNPKFEEKEINFLKKKEKNQQTFFKSRKLPRFNLSKQKDS